LLCKAHGIDSNGVQSFATQLDMKRISAVPHTNTVFRDILKLVPWAAFDKLVKNHGSDELVRSFTTRRQLLALLYGQLSGASSLRDIEASMTSHQGRLYHAGGLVAARSTFADANRSRNPEVFSGLFMQMLAMTTRGLRRKLGDAVRLIDSTSLHLAGAGANWARFSADVCGAKAHVIYDPDLGCPIYHMITEANVNDITAAKAMPIEAGATYVFDLGYYDYGWWAALDDAGCRIVTRFKKNTPLHSAKSMPVEPETGILSDRIGLLPGRQAKSRRNPMQGAVREIVVYRPFRERRSHPDRRRADRFPAAANVEQDVARKTNPARDHSTRANQPDASKRLHPPQAITTAAQTRLTTDHAKLGINMSRTAVGLSRP
jgi:hypothetical protein